MLPQTCPAPTTAERIRSACVRAGGALLAIEHDDPVPTPVHHLIGAGPFAGSFALALPVEREHRLRPVAGRRRCSS